MRRTIPTPCREPSQRGRQARRAWRAFTATLYMGLGYLGFGAIGLGTAGLGAAGLGAALAVSGCGDADDEEGLDPFAEGGGFMPGGGTPGGSASGPNFDPGGAADPGGGAKPVDGAPAPGDPEPGGGGGGNGNPGTTFSGREIILLHDTSAPLPLFPGQHLTLSAQVIDYALGGPASGALLGWTIIDAVGPGAPGDATLSHEATFTAPSGQSNVQFSAGSASQVIYTVEVTAESAVPRTLQVRVDAKPTADLRVEMTYDGPVPLNNVTVRVMPGSFKCSQFIATNPPGGLDQKTVLSTTSQPVFAGLPGDTTYTVFATALGPGGSLAGAGCRDLVYAQAGQQTVVSLDLYVLVLNPTGTYDLDNTFDFTGAVPGQIGQVLDTLAQLFYNPGAFLIEQIKNLVKQFVPGFITDAVFGLFEKQLAKIITDWVLNDSPSWVQDFFTIGQDLLQVVAKLQLTGLLQVSKLQNDYFVEGQISFTGIVFSWKLGCDKSSPDYDQCGLFPFSLDQIDNAFPLDLLSGSWTGTISQLDQLTVHKHTLALNYGKLILFVFHELILKSLTGQDSLVDAVAAMVGCGSIGNALGGLGIFNPKDVENACKGAVGLLVMPLQSYLLGLETDSLVSLQGSALLRDDDDDLVVDRMVNGVWSGLVVVSGASGNPFSGVWSATKK